jgi:hypothetical protein
MLEFFILGIIVLLLAIAFGVIYYLSKDTKTIGKEWDEVGQRLGLGRYRKLHDHHGVSGVVSGMHTTAYWVRTGTTKPHITTYISIDLNADLPAGLVIKPERAWDKVFGGEDTEVGAGTFDRAFTVTGADAQQARAYLMPAHRQEALLEGRKLGSDYFQLENGKIIYTFHYLLDGDKIEQKLTSIVKIAQRFVRDK